ncbi:MAG: hypothetical protein JJU02_14750 [Cryomorphaceae bacterium]|nr:hypothetical protein [Cryomorphaceae bacterium]
MSIPKSILYSSLFLIFTLSCKSKKEVVQEAEKFTPPSANQVSEEEEMRRRMECSPILRHSQHKPEYKMIADVTDAEINGGCLSIGLYYSGCQVTNVVAYYQRVENTNPPQILITIGVQDPGMCDMILNYEASLDLGDIQGHGTGEVEIRIDGYDEVFSYYYATR